MTSNIFYEMANNSNTEEGTAENSNIFYEMAKQKQPKKIVNRGQFSFIEGSERPILRALSRAGETALGLPGDIKALGEAGADFLLNKVGLPTPQQEPKVNLPTSTGLTNFMNKVTGGYLEPQTGTERFADDVVRDFAMLVTGRPNLNSISSIAKPATVALGSNTLGKLAEFLGFSEGTQAAVKLAGLIGGDVATTLKPNTKITQASSKTTKGNLLSEQLRKVGASEKEIQTAINATERQGGKAEALMKKNVANKELVKQSNRRIDKLVDKHITEAFNSTKKVDLANTKDLKKLKEISTEMYNNLPIIEVKTSEEYIKPVEDVIKKMKNTLATSDSVKSDIALFEESINTVKKGIRGNDLTLDTLDYAKETLGYKAPKLNTKESFINARDVSVYDLIAEANARQSQALMEKPSVKSEAISNLKEALGVENLNKSEFQKIEKIIRKNNLTEKELEQVKGILKKEPLKSDRFINFYQELNLKGKWEDPRAREMAIKGTNEAIVKALRKEGKDGKLLADQFEQANNVYSKYANAEEVGSILNKATVEGKLNYKKLNKLLDDTEEFAILEEHIGKNSVKILKNITEYGKNIQGLEAKLNKTSKILPYAVGSLIGSVIGLNPKAMLTSLGLASGANAVRNLSSKIITDPEYQKLTLRMMKTINRINKEPLSTAVKALSKQQAEMEQLIKSYDLEENDD